MKKLTNLLALTAVVAATALPAAAFEATAREKAPGTNDQDAMTIPSGDAAAMTPAATPGDLPGSSVVTADGTTVGTVTDAVPMEDGSVRITVALDDALPTAADAIALDVPEGAVTDGTVMLALSEAALISSLNQQSGT